MCGPPPKKTRRHGSLFRTVDVSKKDPEIKAIDKIPLEIFMEIFSYLPTTYWKQARLVCKKWFAASNHPSIVKHKKFLFNGVVYNNDVKMISDTLVGSSLKYYNLELHKTKNLKEEDLIFMESDGAKIHYLNFYHCTFSFKALEKVMKNCINLEELRFDKCDLDDTPILKIEEFQIKNENLKVLGISECDWMSDLLFSIFISVYPNVKEIVMNFTNMIYDRTIFNNQYVNRNSNCPSDKIFTFLHFYRTIAQKCEKLKILNLNTTVATHNRPNGPSLTSDDLIALGSAPNLKFREISILGHRNIKFNGWKTFLSQQRNLISVNVSSCPPFNFECFQYLLRQNPNLGYLSLNLYEANIPKTALYESIVKSQLHTFHCNIFKHDVIDDKDKPIDTSLKNVYIKHLDFYTCTNTEGGTILLPMLKAFDSLTYLDLSQVRFKCKAEGQILSSYIFTHMVNLETIILAQCRKWITDESFRKTTGCLKNLKYLDLSDCELLTKNAIRTFHYPKLRFLYLVGCEKIENDGFAHLPQSSPLLEYLNVGYTEISGETLLEICSKLKFLHTVHVHKTKEKEEREINYATIQDLVQRCPNLRMIRSKTNEVFVYNYFQKKLIQKRSNLILSAI